MLGTNDAKDAGSGGPTNWPHDCTGAEALNCPFAQDYASMINLVKTLGVAAATLDPTPRSLAYSLRVTIAVAVASLYKSPFLTFPGFAL